MENEIAVSDSEFDERVVKKSGEIPVVVDFWAPWCGPCNMLAPVLKKLTEEYGGKFVLVKVNVDENTENAQKYGVSGIPAVMMFKSGEVVAEFVGNKAETMVREWLDKGLG